MATNNAITGAGTGSEARSEGAPPHSTPKRAREHEQNGEDPGEQPLTLALLQQALQVSQREITHSLHESLEGIGRRVENLEGNFEQHVERTTQLLGAMTDRHCDIEHTVKKVDQSYEEVRRRLELLEGKFATASFSTTTNTSLRSTDTGGQENARPAVIMGGWDADQSASETLRLVKQHIAELHIDIDMDDAFVPGIRRGFAIVPVAARANESQGDFRARLREALKEIRESKVITGQRPEGGDRHFWAAMCESPERRKRAQFAGKVKRLILEMQGDKHKLDVEFGTGNVWYSSVKIASATTSPPPGAETDPGEVHAVTWNVGGLTPLRALQLLRDLRKERIHPFHESFVLLLQEIVVDEGKHTHELDDIQMIAGKRTDDWRGTAIAHTADMQHNRHKLLDHANCAVICMNKLRVTVTSGHIPHHCTVIECCGILENWKQHVQGDRKIVIGMDANETFKAGHETDVLSDSARGELILTWWMALKGDFPIQQLAKPSYYPYNHRMNPRRLDYVLTKTITTQAGDVGSLRNLAISDHEPVWVPCLMPLARTQPAKREKPWGCRQLRNATVVEKILDDRPRVSGDPLWQLREIAVAVTKPGRGILGFRESEELKTRRQLIIRMIPGDEQRRQWKEVLKLRRQEHRQWKTTMHEKAGKGFWHSKKIMDSDGHTTAWELQLQDDERWRETLHKHFSDIFNKQRRPEVDRKISEINDKLTAMCKLTKWCPFDETELKAVRKRWKNGKSCGLDSIANEALKALSKHDYWRGKLLYFLNDLLYVGKLPQGLEAGVTVLLAKCPTPQSWGDTRPITLSSTLLKTFSQLIIHRTAHMVQGPSRLQWSRRHRQGVELIMMLRKVCRTAHDWGIPMYIAKLDIRKAFDSIYQEALAEQIAHDVGEVGGSPWEARAWVQLLHAQKVTVHFRGENFDVDQTNGVRQGSPDSPIAFGRVVALELERSIQQSAPAKCTFGEPPPEDGCCYMDDSYIWSTTRHHLQTMLDRLGDNLPPKGLDIHPDKTEIIDNQQGGVSFQVAGNTVTSKGPKHIIRTLGSPICFASPPAILVAEMQGRGRRAFSKHRGTLMSKAPLKSRLQLHTVLVRQSALWACETWPCVDYVLKAANALQLLHTRTMMSPQRHAGESWPDWNARTMRRARLQLHQCKIDRWSSFILQQIWGLMGHIARGDIVASKMLRWRDLRWWRIEQSVPQSWGGERHASRFHPLLDVERQISDIAGEAWQETAQNRLVWETLGEQFVERFDVPWTSGNQAQLENLAPNRAAETTTRTSTKKRKRKPRMLKYDESR
ncbi:pol [Symbiodinium sp. CCMP2592]|nr:pol [Symbiodinium sp. CCMP2592]